MRQIDACTDITLVGRAIIEQRRKTGQLRPQCPAELQRGATWSAACVWRTLWQQLAVQIDT